MAFRDHLRQPISTRPGNWLRPTLLTLATIHFVCFYLLQAPSGIDFPAYEQGRERMPFQGRLLLEPLLRWAHSALFTHVLSLGCQRVAWVFPGRVQPETIAEAAVSFFCVAVAASVAQKLYARSSRTGVLGVLVAPAVLAMAFLMFAAATSHRFRFPYDLPQMALFSLGLLLIYDRRLVLFAVVFALATLNKETSILLLLYLLLAERARGRRLLPAFALSLLLGFLWAGWQVWLRTHYAHNPSGREPRLLMNLLVLATPLFWPQIASAFAYLLPAVLLGRQQIHDPVLRAWLLALPVWAAFMFCFGLLLEIRVFGELIPVMAASAMLIAEEHLLLAVAPPKV